MPSTHLDTERIERLLHGEVSPSQGTSARDHLATCAPCRRRLADAEAREAEVYALLRRLDHPPPEVDAATIAARARRWKATWARWAAGILLALGAAGAVYAAPGSPLRALVEALAGRSPAASTDRHPQAPDPGAAGIAVAPGQRFVIAFASAQAAGRATVSLADGAEVVVRAVGGSVTFASAVDRLAIENEGSTATFEIEVPRSAPWVEILVAGRRVFVKDGHRVTADDSVGPYDLRLTIGR